MQTQRYSLQYVHYMPRELKPGILYVSKEYDTAAHLCACGCGEKVRTPLDPTGWRISKGKDGPSLYPSIGNWQHKCKSHYFIRDGKVIWANSWSSKQIEAGRRNEEIQRGEYYESLRSRKTNRITLFFQKLYHLLFRR
jgi:hypothetical protein